MKMVKDEILLYCGKEAEVQDIMCGDIVELKGVGDIIWQCKKCENEKKWVMKND